MRGINEKGKKTDQKTGHQVLDETWHTDRFDVVEFFKRETMKIEQSISSYEA